MIQIDDDVGNNRNQAAQDFSLHRSEIKEAIQHQEFYLLQPGQGNTAPGNFAAQNLERAQLVGIFISQAETIQRFNVR